MEEPAKTYDQRATEVRQKVHELLKSKRGETPVDATPLSQPYLSTGMAVAGMAVAGMAVDSRNPELVEQLSQVLERPNETTDAPKTN